MEEEGEEFDKMSDFLANLYLDGQKAFESNEKSEVDVFVNNIISTLKI